jgi:hypothetical protein
MYAEVNEVMLSCKRNVEGCVLKDMLTIVFKSLFDYILWCLCSGLHSLRKIMPGIQGP